MPNTFQVDPFTQYDADLICEASFILMAWDAGFPLEEIEAALAKHRVESPFERETMQ